MRVLVTGGAGYVGGFTARHLAAAGHEVVVLDDLSEGHRPAAPPGALVTGDVGDRAGVGELLRERGIEAVMHFAASAKLGESVVEPRRYYRNNVAGTLGLLEAMVDGRVPRLVFSSTCAIYGDAPSPLGEDLPARPASPYAFTKHAIEQMIRDFAAAYGLRYALLRYFNAAGASPDGAHGEHHQPETHLLPLAFHTVLGRRERMAIHGDDYPTPDGTCIRDYVHVEDLARAHARALETLPAAGEGRAYNLGTGTGHSVLEVIDACERVAGRAVDRVVIARRPGDVPQLVADPRRARRELGWEPEYATLESIAATAWEWHRRHPDGYAEEGEGRPG